MWKPLLLVSERSFAEDVWCVEGDVLAGRMGTTNLDDFINDLGQLFNVLRISEYYQEHTEAALPEVLLPASSGAAPADGTGGGAAAAMDEVLSEHWSTDDTAYDMLPALLLPDQQAAATAASGASLSAPGTRLALLQVLNAAGLRSIVGQSSANDGSRHQVLLDMLDDMLAQRCTRAVAAGTRLLGACAGRGLPAVCTWLLDVLSAQLPAGELLDMAAASSRGMSLVFQAVHSGSAATLQALLSWGEAAGVIWDWQAVQPGLHMTALQATAALSGRDGGAIVRLILGSSPEAAAAWSRASGAAKSSSPSDVAHELGILAAERMLLLATGAGGEPGAAGAGVLQPPPEIAMAISGAKPPPRRRLPDAWFRSMEPAFADPQLERAYSTSSHATLLQTDRLHGWINMAVVIMLRLVMPWSTPFLLLIAFSLLRNLATSALPPATYLRYRVPLCYATRGLGYWVIPGYLGAWIASQTPLGVSRYVGVLAFSQVEGLRATFGCLVPFRHHVLLQALDLLFLVRLGPAVCGAVVPGTTTARFIHLVAGVPLQAAAAFSTALGLAPVAAWLGQLGTQCQLLAAVGHTFGWVVVPLLLRYKYERLWREQWYFMNVRDKERSIAAAAATADSGRTGSASGKVVLSE